MKRETKHTEEINNKVAQAGKITRKEALIEYHNYPVKNKSHPYGIDI
jgi:hypothetical protein